MKRFTPTLWLSFGLVSITLALTLTAYLFGFMPDGYKTELESRAKVAESLAVQLAGAVNRNDNTALTETMESVVSRNKDVLSGAIRRVDGSIVIESGEHSTHWVPQLDGRSTPMHVSVPLIGAEGPQGAIEIAFGPPSSGGRLFGFPLSLLMFLGFITVSGFVGYFFILRRALHQLDPGRVIPERVQKAFDTLNEGVIILDEKERMLLFNNAFIEMYGLEGIPEIGSKINALPWRMVDGRASAGGYPWHTAIREGREMREDAISLRAPGGVIHNFNVNATVIAGDNGKTIGAIVTLRDMTNANRSKEELSKAVDELNKMQREFTRQNRELNYLANHDSLTGCLNRRAFFGRFETDIDQAPDLGTGIATLMISVDQFAATKSKMGPVAADAVIIGVANILRATCSDAEFVSRHSGAEFCIAMIGSGEDAAEKMAELLKKEVAEASTEFMSGGMRATLSVGITHRTSGSCTAQKLVQRADQALNHARRSGSGNSVIWQKSMVDDARATDIEITHEEDAQLPTPELAASDEQGQAVERLKEVELKGREDARAFANFNEGVERSLAHAERRNQPMAVLHVSVVSWEYLEEAVGAESCQKLLSSLERKAIGALRETDHVFVQNESGELLIDLAELEQPDDATWVVKRLLDALHETLQLNGESLHVACKVGISLFPNDGRTVSELIRNAGVAMRRAREEDSLDGYKYFTAEMTQSSKVRLDVESGIREALVNDQFELFFQPIINANTGAISAAEALLRCTNSRLLGVPMDTVIGVAEKSTLIAEIDLWVMRNVLAQMQKWDKAGINLPKASWNISAKQLTNVPFMDTVFETVKSASISPARLQIEITETAKVADVEVAAPQIKRLQQLGVQIALDDFGTGQASLTYLQRLHPDVIKIDRSFITGVNSNHANATLVSAVAVMARCLGLKVVAEGVETEEQMSFLRDIECDEIQGYLVSKPMPARIMGKWMKLFVHDKSAAKGMVERSAQSKLEPLQEDMEQAA